MPVAATLSSNNTIATRVDVSRVVRVGFVIPGSEFDFGEVSLSFLVDRLSPNAEMRKDRDVRKSTGGRFRLKNKLRRRNLIHPLFHGGVVLVFLVGGQSISFTRIEHKMGGETSPWRAKWPTIAAKLAAKPVDWLRDAGLYKFSSSKFG